MTQALAHPNIALVKYWGKQNKAGNMPATPNLSITLSELCAKTRISNSDQFEFQLNGQIVDDLKVKTLVDSMTQEFNLPPLRIESSNNFPTSAGLASSAAGFAALVTATRPLPAGHEPGSSLGMGAARFSQRRTFGVRWFCSAGTT